MSEQVEQVVNEVVNGDSTTVEVVNGDHTQTTVDVKEEVKIDDDVLVKSTTKTETTTSVSEDGMAKSTSTRVVTMKVTEKHSSGTVPEGEEGEGEQKPEEKEEGDKKDDDNEDKKDDGEDKKGEDGDTQEEELKAEKAEDTKAQVNGTKTPKKDKKDTQKASNPNSPAKKLLRFFACGSDTGDKSDSRNSMEGEKSKLHFSDPSAESWEGPTKVDIGLSIVTKLEGEEGEESPHHYAAQVTRHGIADQFGIRVRDELLMLNFFRIAGKSQPEVIQLFEDEITGRKTRLLFRRKVEIGKNVSYDYHYVTGFVELVEQSITEGGDKPVHIEYHVNHIQHKIVRDSTSEYIVTPPDNCHGANMNDSQRYFCYENDKLSAATDFDGSDKFLFDMIMRIVMKSLETQVFMRHKMDSSTNYAFMEETTDYIVNMKEEANLSGTLPTEASPSETLLLHGISNKNQIYAFQSITDSTYMATNGSSVVMQGLPDGRSLGDDTELQFQMISKSQD